MKTFDQMRENKKNLVIEATAGDHEEAAMAHEIAAKSVRQDLRAKKAHQRAAEHHYDAADHIEDGNHEKANASHVKAKNASATAKQYGNKHSANAYADTHAVKRVPSTVAEGYASAAQRKAIWANKADGGKGHPDNKKEAKSADVKPEKYIGPDGKTKIRMVPVTKEDTSAAVKAFLAKGGKIKKLPPAKAQGYHGKDDPGADMHGILDKPDTKDMGTRKKVKSMGEDISKLPSSRLKYHATKGMQHGRYTNKEIDAEHKRRQKVEPNYHTVKPSLNMEATQVDEISKDTKKRYIKKAADDMSRQADRMARAQRGDGKMDKAVNKFVNRRKGIARALEAKHMDPPFDDAKPISTTPTKDQFGNVIKNRAKSLARAAAKKASGDMGDKQKKESVNELDQKTMNSYHAKAQRSKDRATNSAIATILRKGDHSKDLQTRNKREKGMALAKTRTLKSIRGDK